MDTARTSLINDQRDPHNILVIGANGGIGRQVVEMALKEGFKVTALLRTPSNLGLRHDNLEIVQGDVMRPETIEPHFAGKDVVISAIGKDSLKQTTLYSQGVRNVIAAMKNARTQRGFFISASGLEVNPSHSWAVRSLTKYVLQNLLKNMYDDLRRMETLIKVSAVNWTIVRPPRLLNKPSVGKYRVAVDRFLQHCLTISRADVAHYIIHNLKNEFTYRTTVEIAY